MDYVSLPAAPEDEDAARLCAVFSDIDKKARLSGSTALIMDLDRVPGLLLGPSNCVPEGAQDAANNMALEALERIARSLHPDT